MSRQFLVMRLEGPMLSYGGVAVDFRRPSNDFPGKSMLTGLLAQALGLHLYHDRHRIQRLQDRISYAARNEALTAHGNAELTDYQSATTNPDDAAWTTFGVPQVRTGDRNSIERALPRFLEYRTGLRTTVALTLEEPDELPTVEQLAHALIYPAKPLFLGRKSCPPSDMIARETPWAENALEALHQIPSASAADEDPVQWDGDATHPSATKLQELWTHDLRNWDHGVHTGRRLVNAGLQTPGAKEGKK